jgi:hypothetical protein
MVCTPSPGSKCVAGQRVMEGCLQDPATSTNQATGQRGIVGPFCLCAIQSAVLLNGVRLITGGDCSSPCSPTSASSRIASTGLLTSKASTISAAFTSSRAPRSGGATDIRCHSVLYMHPALLQEGLPGYRDEVDSSFAPTGCRVCRKYNLAMHSAILVGSPSIGGPTAR